MFKIGEFSKLSQVPAKTLRYYDQLGLFKPAKVDRFTGYRYYSASQLPRLNRILALKDLGLTLEQIGDLLEGDLTPDQIRGILRMKQSEIKQQVAEEQARLARVEQRLKQIEQEEAMPTQEVVIKHVPAQTIASVRDTVTAAGIAQLFGELFGYQGEAGGTAVVGDGGQQRRQGLGCAGGGGHYGLGRRPSPPAACIVESPLRTGDSANAPSSQSVGSATSSCAYIQSA